MWSLGLITLLLMTYCGSDAIAKLPIDQAELQDCIHDLLATPTNGYTTNAKMFILGCLQVSPKKRLSSEEADTHAWLRTPLTHLKFFQEMDDRILADWKLERELRPTPYELPDVLVPTSPAKVSQEVVSPKATTAPIRSPAVEKSESHSTFVDEGNTPTVPRQTTKNEIRVVRVKSARPSSPRTTTQKRIARIKARNIRVSDSLQLPINSLEKHLSCEKPDRRPQVLQKLQETNARFISRI